MPATDVIDPRFDVNPTLPGVPDPYPIYRAIREADPVHWCPGAQLWAVLRYEDAQSVLKDPRLSRQAYLDGLEARTGPQPIIDMQRHELVFTDNPRHGQLRRLIGEAINAHAIHDLQAKIETLVERTMAPLVARGKFDVINDFALTLPTSVACAWLGVDDADRVQITNWIVPIHKGRGVARDPETTAAANVAANELNAYFLKLIRQRRAAPTGDLICGLLAAQAQDETLLSEGDLVAIIIAVFAAGHGPGISMLAHTLLALFKFPDQFERLKADPALLSSALEEGLRFDAPTQAPNPFAALEDVQIGGKTIRKGEAITVILAAANRDRAAFPEPERFDITRTPNRHLSFSGGAHYCLGAMLARMEVQGALAAIIRLPKLKLACDPGELTWIPRDRFRTMAALPISFRAA